MENSYKILTGISHEIRSQMTTIVGLAYLLESSAREGEKDINYSNEILNACDKLMGLFENYIDSSIMDLGNSRIAVKRCKLNSIINTVLPQFSEILERKKKKGLVLINENDLYDSTEVYIDLSKVIRAVHYLFQNAVTTVGSGYIRIGYTLIKDRVIFYILDTGQDFIKAKEYFNTAEMDISLMESGDINSAISITLAKRIVKLLGGNITIENHELTGTGFYMSFPVKIAERNANLSRRYFDSEPAGPDDNITGLHNAGILKHKG
jgi:K+-sensing histidine kinase KdpD